MNCIGLLGGFVSPMIIGSIKTATNSMAGGLGAISLLMLIGALAAIVLAPKTTGAGRSRSLPLTGWTTRGSERNALTDAHAVIW